MPPGHLFFQMYILFLALAELRRTADGAKIVEQAVYLLGKTYAAQQDTERLVQLMDEFRGAFCSHPRIHRKLRRQKKQRENKVIEG